MWTSQLPQHAQLKAENHVSVCHHPDIKL